MPGGHVMNRAAVGARTETPCQLTRGKEFPSWFRCAGWDEMYGNRVIAKGVNCVYERKCVVIDEADNAGEIMSVLFPAVRGEEGSP